MSRASAPASRVWRSADGATMAGAGGVATDSAGDALDAASRGGGGGLPAELRGRLEHALGTDLAPVQLHADGASASAAASIGARAYTIGQNIHFGAGQFNPDTQSGQRLIAHEVAHTVQQRGVGGGVQAKGELDISEPGEHHEVEADRFADMFVRGERAEVSAVSVGSVSRMVQRDEGEEEGGGFADRALGWVLDRVTDAASLMSALGSLSASMARRAIDIIATRAPQILVSFLELNPTYHLVAYIVRKLPTARIRALLESVDVNKAKAIIGALADAGMLVVIGPILFALAPERARAIISNLDREVIAPLFRVCNAQAKRFVKSILGEFWPVGLGMAVGAGIGATFGYPIYVGGDANFTLSRSTDENFKFMRRGEARVAADTGVGAGVFIGTGGQGRGGGSANSGGEQRGGGVGIGATAGAQAQAGVKMIVMQDFEFPVFQDAAFLSMLIAITGNDTSTTFTVGSMMFDSIAAMNPMLYNTMTKFEAKAYGEANASAEAGVRVGGENTIEGGATWNRQQGAADTGSSTWWSRLLGLMASVSGRAAVEGGLGVQINQEWGEDRSQGPTKIGIELSIETGAALQIVHSIPFLSSHLPQLPQLDGAVGAKVMFEATGQGEGEPQLQYKGVAMFAKTGDMDLYAGEASETTLGVNSMDPENFADLDSFLNNINGGVEFKRRFSVGSTMGRNYLRYAGRQRTFTTMLPAQYRAFGFTLEGYLDLTANLTVDQVRTIIRTVHDAGAEMFRGDDAMQRLYTQILTFLSSGEVPAYISGALRTIANTILSSVTQLKLHGQAGLRVGAGGQVGAGAKVRLHGSGSGMITLDHDILASVQGRMTVADIEQLLRSGIDTARGYIEIDGTDTATADPAAVQRKALPGAPDYVTALHDLR